MDKSITMATYKRLKTKGGIDSVSSTEPSGIGGDVWLQSLSSAEIDVQEYEWKKNVNGNNELVHINVDESNNILLYSQSGDYHALDTETGQEIWSTNYEEFYGFWDEALIFSRNRSFYAVDPLTRQQLYRGNSNNDVRGVVPNLEREEIIVGVQDNDYDAEVYEYNLNGEDYSDYDPKYTLNSFNRNIVKVSENIFVDGDRYVYSLNPLERISQSYNTSLYEINSSFFEQTKNSRIFGSNNSLVKVSKDDYKSELFFTGELNYGISTSQFDNIDHIGANSNIIAFAEIDNGKGFVFTLDTRTMIPTGITSMNKFEENDDIRAITLSEDYAYLMVHNNNNRETIYKVPIKYDGSVNNSNYYENNWGQIQ